MTKLIRIDSQCNWPGCDVLAPQDSDSVIEKTLTVDGKESRTFDLCKPHLVAFEEVVLPLLESGEKPLKQKRQSPARAEAVKSDLIDCKVPGCPRQGSRGVKKRVGMAQHVRRTHHYSNLAAYETEFGKVET